ncbi:MAG: TIGR00266 family protein [Candidatus Aenigmarchaeota archaeon]|nr:TIGR00266 family protein [Candidatus Aenigmarchaeota archaeon]
MKYDLQGTTMQILNTELAEGERIVSESGRLVFMSDNVKMDTKMKGGFWTAIKRKFAGESFFLVEFTPVAGPGIVAFGSEFPGKIIPLNIRRGEAIIAQKDAFLCSETSVTFDATWTRKMGAGFLGGEGLILIKLTGQGLSFFNVGGEVSVIDLKPGQKIRVDTGNLAMFDASVDYSVERVKGVKNIIWGGEGLFLATCTGPGRVWVQSMPVSELAGKLSEYMPQGHGAAGGFAAGAILGSMGKR